MANKKEVSLYMRTVHRYLGFFLAGIMAIYAVSGIVMIFRNTDTFKRSIQIEKQVEPNIASEALGKALDIRRLKVEKTEGALMYFEEGVYNSETGLATYTEKELPYVLEKLTHLHKATTKDPLYWLNIFFGCSLLFFVISAFWMFMPSTQVFRKGMYFTLAGIALTLLMLFL